MKLTALLRKLFRFQSGGYVGNDRPERVDSSGRIFHLHSSGSLHAHPESRRLKVRGETVNELKGGHQKGNKKSNS